MSEPSKRLDVGVPRFMIRPESVRAYGEPSGGFVAQDELAWPWYYQGNGREGESSTKPGIGSIPPRRRPPCTIVPNIPVRRRARWPDK